MILNFQTYYYNGSNVIMQSLTLDVTTHYSTGSITRTITLDNTNSSEDIELINDKGIGVITTFTYNNLNGILDISNDYLLPVDSIQLDMVLHGENNELLPLDILTFDVQLGNTIYIIADNTIAVKASTMFIQEPLSNKVYFYNLTNSPITECSIEDSQVGIISSSSTGVYASDKSMFLTTTYTYTYFNGTTFITISDSTNMLFNHNIFLPTTDTSFTNNGFLYKGFPTENTKFEGHIISNYTNIQDNPQENYIMKVNPVRLHITVPTGDSVIDKYKSAQVNSSTNVLSFVFDEITNLIKQGYIVNLSNYIVNDVAGVPVVGNILISGLKYYVAAANECTSITDGTTTLPVVQGGLLDIDPALFGIPGTSISFTDVNNMTVLQTINVQDVVTNLPYYIVSGTVTINGIVYPTNSTIFISTDDIVDAISNAEVILLTQSLFYNEEYKIAVYDGIEITNDECNTYTIYNNSLNNITIDIYKLIYTVDRQGEYDILETITIISGDKYNFIASEDGVYKFDIIDSNNPKQLYIVATCNVENCLIKYINDLVCCNDDSNCECNLQGHDCKYIDRSNFIATSLLYDLLKNMIIDVIGINQVYNDTISDDALYLHSITDIINRISNFCNTCDE